MMWHGWADQLIYPQGTIDYFERVQEEFGESRTRKFSRLFMAPGVAHCGGGTGPPPNGQFEALVRWVEKGDAPDARCDSNRREWQHPSFSSALPVSAGRPLQGQGQYRRRSELPLLEHF